MYICTKQFHLNAAAVGVTVATYITNVWKLESDWSQTKKFLLSSRVILV